jgi:hypothetical protein
MSSATCPCPQGHPAASQVYWQGDSLCAHCALMHIYLLGAPVSLYVRILHAIKALGGDVANARIDESSSRNECIHAIRATCNDMTTLDLLLNLEAYSRVFY